ncbi:MAG: serine hydrolase [Haliscomenobacter sp.]|uniref:serine hydrolase domain-containing protein n=1 Tax=Haliscomenobacter sp. TaxID=2717303 RepID=UPI00299FC446|nr:serine hydrolase [Haliscomenobacter sp.]MDX2066961.1 serine hydrolase [Haliscomenobacter sp.]
MKKWLFLLLFLPIFLFAQKKKATLSPSPTPEIYFPSAQNWEKRDPASLGLNPAKIKAAIQYAQEQESSTTRDLELAHYQSFGREPFGEAVGPLKARGPSTGLIIYKGYIVAEWGEPNRVDMTFSVTKSMVSSTVGLAVDRGMIKSVHDTVYPYMAPIWVMEPGKRFDRAEAMGQPQLLDLFDTPHNRKITWDQLLRQTSSWQGTLWGKPDWADRPAQDSKTWLNPVRATPGTVYEYNDCRVNVLALATLNIWRRPLPQVLKEYIMDPIGASNTWRWYGYDNSWVLMDGQVVQSVSGGGHWGGGMFIHAYDMARFGYLSLHKGKWKGQQLLSEDWYKMATTPTQAKTDYGFMNYFLNTDQKALPSAPATAFWHLGNGNNVIFVLPDQDFVVVARWLKGDGMDGLVKRVLEAKE